MRKKKINYLDYKPVPMADLFYETLPDQEKVVLHLEHRGFYAKIAQKIFGRPKISKIHLDELGSFLWNSMDGKKDVYQLSQLVREKFGEQAEPVLPRLITYVNQLKEQRLIQLK